MPDIVTTITITLRTKDVITDSELMVIMGNVAEHIYGERDSGIVEFAKVTDVDVCSKSDIDLTPTEPAA